MTATAEVQNVTQIQGILWKGAAKTYPPLAQRCRVSALEYSLQGKPVKCSRSQKRNELQRVGEWGGAACKGGRTGLGRLAGKDKEERGRGGD